ncbi:AMP-binding protein [Pseudomonas botevensis]|uniref:AMP-binding protein n=1 Tax=Pseudomonas botevensis TaxID=2842352 RepID=UPI001C3E3F48|nr:AMP-binding protein [Pseudomonas botevensis]MBV4477580.1 AMP-binding protein [Pseudomonas botevensis]
MTHSLADALLQQANNRGAQIALRYKRLGIWQARTWRELADDVQRLATALREQGFASTQTLVIVSEAKAEALLMALAAQWLGGSVSLLDPATDNRQWLLAQTPEWVFAQGLNEVLQVQQTAPVRLIYLDKRGLSVGSIPGLIAYEQLLGAVAGESAQPVARGIRPAFILPSPQGQRDVQLTDADLLFDARRLVAREHLTNRDQALAARVFAASGQARYLLAPWLVAGFCLNFPEALSTRDSDRRELGPTLVLGTRESYARLEGWARERLPPAGSFSHRLYQWAMQPGPRLLRRALGYWLIRRPLRDVLGMSRLSTALLVGDSLTPQSAVFYAALGIHPQPLRNDENIEVQAEPAITLIPQSA